MLEKEQETEVFLYKFPLVLKSGNPNKDPTNKTILLFVLEFYVSSMTESMPDLRELLIAKLHAGCNDIQYLGHLLACSMIIGEYDGLVRVSLPSQA